ncbi:MAG: SMC family ATPase [Candidatus Anstonellales archaeon]
MIQKLILQNWMSHRDTQISFRHGKILIHGKNGSGKTSIVEGIVFALFGEVKTSYRGINKQNRRNFIRDGEKSAKVEIEFSVDGKNFRIVRNLYRDKPSRSALYYNSNLISENDDEILKHITRVLNIDERLFGNVFYGAQDNIYQLINMPPKELKLNIDRVLGIEEIQDRIDKITKIINRIKDQIKQTEIDLDGYRTKQKELERLKSGYQTTLSRIEELNSQFRSLQNDYESMTKQKETIEQKYNTYIQYRDKKIATETKIDRLNQDIKKLQQIISNTQLEDPEVLEEKRLQLEKEIEQFRLYTDQSMKLNDLQNQLNQKYDSVFRNREDLYRTLQERNLELDTLRKELEQLNRSKPSNLTFIIALILAMGALGIGIFVINLALLPSIVFGIAALYLHIKYNEQKSRWSNELERVNNDTKRIEAEISSIQNELNGLEQELEKLKNDKNSVSEQLKDIMSKIPSDYGKELERRRDQISRALGNIESYKKDQKRLLELRQELENFVKNLESIDQTLKSLEINDKIYREWSKRYVELQEAIKRTKSEINLLTNQSREFQKSIEILERDIEDMKRKIERVEILRALQKELEEIKNRISDLQTKNRQVYIQNINLGMGLFWNSLYAGVVYNDPKIAVDKSDGYELKISIGDNEVSADRLSGGEKTIYALSLRLAILNLITRRLRVIILDEPTHNLDDSSIDNLVDNINRLSLDHIDQFIIITHDDRLKNNVMWNQVIQVFREKSKDGSVNYSKVLL